MKVKYLIFLVISSFFIGYFLPPNSNLYIELKHSEIDIHEKYINQWATLTDSILFKTFYYTRIDWDTLYKAEVLKDSVDFDFNNIGYDVTIFQDKKCVFSRALTLAEKREERISFFRARLKRSDKVYVIIDKRDIIPISLLKCNYIGILYSRLQCRVIFREEWPNYID